MVSLSNQELDVLKRSHVAIFNNVLKIRPSWLKCDFDFAEKNYLVVPIHFICMTDPVVAYIKFDFAELIASLQSPKLEEANGSYLKSIPWPGSIDQFKNAIVGRLYNPLNLQEVIEVEKDVCISSHFPESEDKTYKDHFTTKYNCTITDDRQPALVCKGLGDSQARMQLLKSRYKNQDGTDIIKSSHHGRTIKLFPEICFLYPLPANLWKLAHSVPSILWRMECILSVSELRARIAKETNIGMLPDNDGEVTTCIDFRGYKDLAYGDLKSKICVRGPQGEKEIMPFDLYNPLGPHLRGPDNVLLLQALTTKSAGDSIDLERLETLGDSFLKFSTTVYLYSYRLTAHEGKLSIARSRRVGNMNLYYLAKRRGITDTIFSSTFEPRQMWTPPCFKFDGESPHLAFSQGDSSSCMSDQERHYLYHKLTDKGVADCIESLIGAYLQAGGIEAGLKFMTWMGIKILHEGNDGDMVEGSTSSDDSYTSLPHPKQMKIDDNALPLFVQNSASILTAYFKPQPSRKFNDVEKLECKRLLSISFGTKDIQQSIAWNFNDRSLLLQAITHASYTKNRLTECYQRLEFLGDAVLDYLVTCHIYLKFPTYGPGDISSMRSALVNNITFAELAVELKLNTLLLYNSPSLYHQIELYLKAVAKYSGEDAEECNMFLSESNYTVRIFYHQYSTPLITLPNM